MNVRSIRRLYRSLVLAKIPATRASCPSVSALREAFEEGTRRKVKDRIVDHISGCSECAREFAFIRAVRGREERLAAGLWKASHPRARVRFPVPRPAWAGIIGIALIGVLLPALLVHGPRRGAEEPRSEASVVPVAITPAGRITPGSSLIFNWKPISGAESYFVEIYDVSLRLTWESPPVGTNALSLPGAVERELAGGKTYFWSVTAILDEDRVAESRLQWFIIDR